MNAIQNYFMEVILLGTLISDKFAAWEAECNQRFNQLKANEEELNRILLIFTACRMN